MVFHENGNFRITPILIKNLIMMSFLSGYSIEMSSQTTDRWNIFRYLVYFYENGNFRITPILIKNLIMMSFLSGYSIEMSSQTTVFTIDLLD